MFYGIDAGYRDYTISIMNEKKEVIYITSFWKEGLYWFIDHHKPGVITINLPDDNLPDTSIKLKTTLELIQKLKKVFEYKVADKQDLKTKEPKLIIKTVSDMFFQKFIRKQMLPITSREGIEQRLYNLKKTGIKINKNILTKDKNRLKNELGAVIASFTSYSINKNSYEVIDEEEGIIVVPKYKFVPSTNRIIKKKKTATQEQ